MQSGKIQMISAMKSYAQRVRDRIRLRLGELAHEPDLGIDWLSIYEKPILLERIQAEIKKAVLLDPESIACSITEFAIDRENREMTLRLQCQTIQGNVEVAL